MLRAGVSLGGVNGICEVHHIALQGGETLEDGVDGSICLTKGIERFCGGERVKAASNSDDGSDAFAWHVLLGARTSARDDPTNRPARQGQPGARPPMYV